MKKDEWNKVAEMRIAQRTYFSTRSAAWLERSKKLEREVDEMINQHYSHSLQSDLFTQQNEKK